MAHDVFISYASSDKVVADAVCAALEADRIRCFIAPRDITPGQHYAQALVDAIRAAKVLVLVFSRASNSSEHVELEVDRAVSCGLSILPLRLEDVMPTDSLDYYLAGRHWLDALSPPLEQHLRQLSEAITVLLQPRPVPPRPVPDPVPQPAPQPVPPQPVPQQPMPQPVPPQPVQPQPVQPQPVQPQPVQPQPVQPQPVQPQPVQPQPLHEDVRPDAGRDATRPGRRAALIVAGCVGATWLIVLVVIQLATR